MPLKHRRKYVLTVLVVYWPVLFLLTHIPIPQIARRSGMSDKTMHFLAYMALVFLWWLTISPYKKVNWLKAKVYLALALMVWYGAVDEWLQGVVGRSADVHDFFADIAGTMAGLVILSIFSFWPAALVTSSIFIFAASNMSRIGMLWDLPYLNTGLHLFGYGIFTLIWIQYMSRLKTLNVGQLKWLFTAMALPTGLLCFVKFCSVYFDKQIWLVDNLIALTAIGTSVLVSWIVCVFNEKESDSTS